jgi:hypothetical protein
MPEHRRRSFRAILTSYAATMAFIGFGLFFYRTSAFHSGFLNGNYKLDFVSGFQLSSWEVYYGLVTLYAVILIPFYWLHPGMRSKVLTALEYPYRRWIQKSSPPAELKARSGTAWRTLAIKFFFAPLMVKFLLDHIFGMLNTGYAVAEFPGIFRDFDSFLTIFNSHLYWFAFDLILFADVFFFTLGYLIETPYLGNEIVSSEPTMYGWVVCLACYVPFNRATNAFLGWHSSDFPHFQDPYVHVSLNMLLLLLMGIYASASVALNWKASNLTNRGVVGSGPYRWVRHPAYVSKNLAWWVGGFPAIYAAFANGNAADIFLVFLGLVGTSTIYTLRALTEERSEERV